MIKTIIQFLNLEHNKLKIKLTDILLDPLDYNK